MVVVNELGEVNVDYTTSPYVVDWITTFLENPFENLLELQTGNSTGSERVDGFELWQALQGPVFQEVINSGYVYVPLNSTTIETNLRIELPQSYIDNIYI